ncbi:MAG: SUMF1/EgtB/PvdO family nonheme iron enzyme [Planctomycetota bacterium]
MQASLRRSLAITLVTILAGSVLPLRARAEDYAVLVSVSRHAFSKYDLPMAAVNREVMEKALGAVGIKQIQVLENERVNPSSIRTLLELVLPRRLNEGDRLFLYFTGHGMAVDVSGAPVRAYFTFETTKDENDKYRTDTLITDLDLESWLKPLRDKGIEVLFIRECCFNGRGYSEALSEAAPADPDKITVMSVADIELSAASLDQAAHAVEGEDKRFVGIFTQELASQMQSTSRTYLTAAELATAVEKRVAERQVGQTPQRGGNPDKFSTFLVFDRRVISLTIKTLDAFNKDAVEGAEVRWGATVQGMTPLKIDRLPRDPGRIYPEIAKEGYEPISPVIELDRVASHQEVKFELKPACAEVVGRVVEASGKDLKGVVVSFEMAGAQARPERLFDTEEKTGDQGEFSLLLPPGHAYNLVLFGGGGSVLARLPIAEGNPLEAKHVRGRPYDMGPLKVTMQREGPTYAEKRFQDKFDMAREALDKKDYRNALLGAEQARVFAEGVENEDSKKSLQERVALLRERIVNEQRRAECSELLTQAQAALQAQDYEGAEALVNKVLALDSANFDAKAMQVEIDFNRPVPSAAGDATSGEAASGEGERRIPDRTLTGRGAAGDLRTHKLPDNTREAEMVYVPAGEFTLGDQTGGGDEDEQPSRRIKIAKGFYIDRSEVTWRQYRKFCDDKNRKYPEGHRKGVREDLPVVNVSWFDAADYAEWAGKRLPTEAEWEYAAKGPEAAMRFFPWGNEREAARANNPDSTRKDRDWERYLKPPGTSGSAGASWCGAEDLAGNVWEWCNDYYAEDAYSKLRPGQVDPKGPTSGTMRVTRGGAWTSSLDGCRVTNRNGAKPTVGFTYVGFRCVWDPQ